MFWALTSNVCDLIEYINFTDRERKCNFVMLLLTETVTHFIGLHYEKFLVANCGELCSTRKERFIIIKSMEKIYI
jgi:hypothetical protein